MAYSLKNRVALITRATRGMAKGIASAFACLGADVFIVSLADLETENSRIAPKKLVLPYWRVVRDIIIRQDRETWGSKAIDRLAAASQSTQNQVDISR